MAIVTPDQFKVPMDSSEMTLESVPAVSEIAAADWDACANPGPPPNSINAPETRGSPDTANDFSVGSKASYTHLFHTRFSRPWKPPARPAHGPAGDRGICSPGWTATSLALCP